MKVGKFQQEISHQRLVQLNDRQLFKMLLNRKKLSAESAEWTIKYRKLCFSEFSLSESKMNYWSVVPFDGELFIYNRV